MKIDRFLSHGLLKQFADKAQSRRRQTNSANELLSHTQMIDPSEDPAHKALAEAATPHLVTFGEPLFAQKLRWTIKEAWLNLLDKGSSQFMHTHANSFVSGIIYVTKPHRSANTVFRKNTGGGEFIFKNDMPLDHYSSDTWILSDVEAGDMVLYPSYLTHGVPPNEGSLRTTLALNTIPNQLDSLGY